MGTKNLKDVILLVLRTHHRIAEAKEDGKISLWETLGVAASSVPDLMTAIEGGDQIWAEIKDLTEEEIVEIRAEIATEYPPFAALGITAGNDIVILVYQWIKSTISVYTTIASFTHPKPPPPTPATP